MGIATQGIKTTQAGDARASRRYLFITSAPKMNTQNEQKFNFFANSNLLHNNQQTSGRFMSSMNPFIA